MSIDFFDMFNNIATSFNKKRIKFAFILKSNGKQLILILFMHLSPNYLPLK